MNWTRASRIGCLPPKTDVVFLALHGTYGEDGTVQAELEKLHVPYTGCGPEASRLAFDKVLTKQRCLEAGIPTARFMVFSSPTAPWPDGWQPPVVLKPVRQGSSVGLQMVEKISEWPAALAESFRHDTQVLMEEKIVGRETTVGILAGQPLPVVEVRVKKGSFDYKNKYTPGAAEHICPAPFPADLHRAHSGRRPGGLSRHRRARLCAGGCDGAARRRPGCSGSQYAARDDGVERAAGSGRRRGDELRAVVPAHD